MKRIFAFFVLWISLPASVWTRPPERSCGWQPGKREEMKLLHRLNRSRPRAPENIRPAKVSGDLVLMEATGGLLDSFNEFDLDATRLRFEPNAAGYTYRIGPSEARRLPAAARDLRLDDDDTALVDLPFAFPYAGQTWRQVWVNSDGNLTFGRPDTASSQRSLGRFVAGPPRVAPLFMDLDPSRAGGVYLETNADEVIITWAGVPEYRSFGIGAPNTFSVTLSRDGAVDLALIDTGTFSAVVGLSRGGVDPNAQLVDLSKTADGAALGATVAERFSATTAIDIVSVSQRFFAQFEDAYDYLVVYNNMGIAPDSGAVAFESTVRNDRTGYGDRELDDGELYGSRRRLQAFLNMGPLSQYPVDPFGRVPARGPTGDTPLSILGHETGHLFLALASIRDPNDAARRPLLGTQNAHWNFAFNSEASLLEGNKITDLGAGQSPRFETGVPVQQYGPLDQYLMGLRGPEEVPPTFLVTNPSVNLVFPQNGVRFNGTRRDVGVDEIIQAEGRRAPDHTLAQRRFRFAFILLIAPGTSPTAEQLAQLDGYRKAFEPYFARVSDNRAEADTSLKRGVRFSTQPTAGVVAGERAVIRLELSQPADRDRVFRLSASEPLVDLPATVTVSRGQSAANLTLSGRAEGVVTLRADAVDDEAYEFALTRVQVAPSRRELRVWIRSGARQTVAPGRGLEPLLVRVTDINRVPYPGLTVVARARGVAVPAGPLVSDAEGELSIAWQAGDGDQRELELSVEGSAAEPARAVVIGAPIVADGGVVNAASGGPGLSPGAWVAVYGLNLTTGEPVSGRAPGSSPLGGTQVEIGGRVAPLLWVADRQVNLRIPEQLTPGVYDILVRTPQGVSAAKPVSIEASWPGIFSYRRAGAGLVELLVTGLGLAGDAVRADLPVLSVTPPLAGLSTVTVQLPTPMTRPVALRVVSRDRSSNEVVIPPL